MTGIKWRTPLRGESTPYSRRPISSRDPDYSGPLSQNRTSAVHIRLFRMVGFVPEKSPHHGSMVDLDLSQFQRELVRGGKCCEDGVKLVPQ